jgi:hypothetical protein
MGAREAPILKSNLFYRSWKDETCIHQRFSKELFYYLSIPGDNVFCPGIYSKMTTEEITGRCGMSTATVCQWAAKNGVRRVIIGGIATYDWTEDDYRRFLERRGRGWTKGRPRKQA